MFNFLDNPKITLIKICAIAFVTILYSLGGIILCGATDKFIINSYYDRTDEELEKKSTVRHLYETTVILGIFGILAYIARNIFQEIPFPLDGVEGFKYMNVKEVASGSLILWIFINYSPVITNKIKIIRKRFSF